MTPRLAAVAAVMAAVTMSSGASAAEESKRLDGHKATSLEYSDNLSGPTVYQGITQDAGSSVTPTQAWCKGAASSCHMTELTLTLPRGRETGRLVVNLTHGGSSKMHVGVYDAEGGEVTPQSACCGPTRVVASQLPPGTYTVVVYDDVGQGPFEVLVSWNANRPYGAPSTSR